MLLTREGIPATAQNNENLVVFRLNRIHYAIAIDAIQQIIEMVTITPILKTEAWMEGVINYHGASIPVVNLRRHFGMEVVPYRWHTPIILVNIKGYVIGLIVDDVLDVRAISQEQIVKPHAIIPPEVPETPLLKSIVQADNRIILLLDLVHLFDLVQVRALATAVEAIDEQHEQTLVEKARKSIVRQQASSTKKKAVPTTIAAPKKKGKTPVVEPITIASGEAEKL